MIDELGELLLVDVEIGDRSGRHAGIHRRLRHRGGDLHDQPRIERLRNQILGAKAQVLGVVRLRHDVRLLGHREVGQRPHRREFHRLVHRRRTDVECAAEDEREAEHVVDLVRIVRAARRYDRVGPRRLGKIGHDLRLGIGERKDQRLVRHRRQPFGLQHLRRRQSEEDVGTGQEVGELARIGLLRVARLVVVHLLLATGIDDARDVGHPDVLPWNAERYEEIQARERGRARARADELDLGDVLADDAQPVDDRSADDDRRAVLIVVEHRDLHSLAQLALDVEAFRRLDVLEIDAAERRLQRRDDLDQLVRVAFVDLDVEAVDARELLEQHRLAFHHGLRGKGADRTQPEHRRAVGDHADQIPARGEVARLGGLADDLVARGRHTGRIGQRQVALVGEMLGRRDRDLAGRKLPVILERGGADFLVGHGKHRRERTGILA